LRLASALVTLPGDETVELKSELLDGLLATHLTVAVGLGNRASDVAAYRHAGLPAARILIKLPEFADEVTPHLTAGEATAVTRYTDLAAGLDAVLGPRR
jgi:threonine dehydratase